MNASLQTDYIKRNLGGHSPSGNYYWLRKREQLNDLLIANQELFKKALGEEAVFMDLGCYTGLDLFLFADDFEKLGIKFRRMVGVDGDPCAEEIFAIRKEADPKPIDFVLADIAERLPFPDHSIDFLYCSEVVEHMPHPEVFLEELKRIIKPGGWLLLTTPNEPNVFQKNYWIPGSRKRMAALRERLMREPQIVTNNGKTTQLYFHVSLLTNQTCDRLVESKGFRLADYRRGAARYGGSSWHDSPWPMTLYFLIEGILDFFPVWLTRNFSDQIIALYRKDTA